MSACSVPVDVARDPLGRERREQALVLRAAARARRRLRGHGDELLEPFVAGFAAVFVDRHGGRAVWPRTVADELRSRPGAGGRGVRRGVEAVARSSMRSSRVRADRGGPRAGDEAGPSRPSERWKSLAALAARLRAGELSPREAVESYLARIEARRDLNAYISVRAEEALAEADAPTTARAAVRRAGRGQGRDRVAEHAHDGGLGDPARRGAGGARRGRVARLRERARSCSAS